MIRLPFWEFKGAMTDKELMQALVTAFEANIKGDYSPVSDEIKSAAYRFFGMLHQSVYPGAPAAYTALLKQAEQAMCAVYDTDLHNIFVIFRIGGVMGMTTIVFKGEPLIDNIPPMEPTRGAAILWFKEMGGIQSDEPLTDRKLESRRKIEL